MSKSLTGTVVTVVTVIGEIVGRLESVGDEGVTLKDPRMFVQVDAERAGFMPGIATTGEVNVSSITIKDYVTVMSSNEHSAKAWMQQTSGIILQ